MLKELTMNEEETQKDEVAIMISSFHNIPLKSKEKQAIQNLRKFLDILDNMEDGKTQIIEEDKKIFLKKVKESVDVLRQYAGELND